MKKMNNSSYNFLNRNPHAPKFIASVDNAINKLERLLNWKFALLTDNILFLINFIIMTFVKFEDLWRILPFKNIFKIFKILFQIKSYTYIIFHFKDFVPNPKPISPDLHQIPFCNDLFIMYIYLYSFLSTHHNLYDFLLVCTNTHLKIFIERNIQIFLSRKLISSVHFYDSSDFSSIYTYLYSV